MLWGTFPGTSRNSVLENWEHIRDRSQNDPYPVLELSTRRTSNSADADQEETSHKIVQNLMHFLKTFLKKRDQRLAD